MISASAQLIALLESGRQFLMADLYDFVTLGGTYYRYTNADVDITWNGNTYASNGLRLKRSRTRRVRGLEVDTLDITVYPTDADLIEGVPFLQALGTGALTGASVTLWRAFMETWGDTAPGALWQFSGRLSVGPMSRTQAQLKVRSDLELLNIQMPRNVYQPACIHTLYDSGCTLSQAGFGVSNTAQAGSTKTSIVNSLAQGAGYFDQGKLFWLTGANAGVTRTVKSYVPGILVPSLPLPYTPAAGDTFTVYPGCDKMQATCSSKFANLVNFRGYPYIPVPETAV